MEKGMKDRKASKDISMSTIVSENKRIILFFRTSNLIL